MRRTRLVAVALVGLVMTAIASCGVVGSDAGGGFTLRVNTGTPPEHHITENVWEPWKQFVEKKTQGRIEVQIYHGSTLGSLSTALSDLRSGVYDASTLVPNYFADSNLFPLTIPGLAFSYPDIATGNKVLSEYITRNAKKINVEGIRMADPTVSDLYVLFSKAPVRKIEDLQGLPVKVQGPSEARLFNAWGANPVQLSTGETYTALERGTISVAPYTVVGVMGTKFYEVAPNVTMLKYAGTVAIPSVSQKFLDRLPSDLRSTFEDSLIPKLSELNRHTYIKELDAAMKKLPTVTEKIIQLSEAELAEFRERAKVQWETWVKAANRKGFDGQALVNDWLSLLKAAGAPAPF